MRKIIKIARREYAETVKTKTFIVSVLMTPVLIGVIIFISGRARSTITGPRPPRRIALADLSGELSDKIKSSFDTYNSSNSQRQILLQQISVEPDELDKASEQQKGKLRRKEIDLYVVMDRDVVSGGKMHLYSRAARTSDLDMVSTVKNLLNQVVIMRRCELRKVSPDLLAELRRRVPVEQMEVGSSQDGERTQNKVEGIVRMMVPFFFMFMMMMGIFGMGQYMITSVIEEKNSRIIEILLSAVSPFELMAGKIMGLAGIGLTVIGLWGVGAYATVRWRGLNIDIPPELLLYFAVYYILGFLLFGSILAGIGSICNTTKEAQSLMMPLSLLIIVPMVSWFNLAQNPEGTLARVLSFVPPLTPMVMMLRVSASGDLAILEILASMIVLVVSVPVVVWMAAKVFRTGILMYGKRPKAREMLRWISQS